MKVCNKCKKEKDLVKFRVNHNNCRDCENEDHRKYMILYRSKNSDNIKKSNKVYYNLNSEKIKKRVSDYNKNNRESRREYNRVYERNRYKNDLSYKLKRIAKDILRRCLNGVNKNARTFEMLGYDSNKLKLRIECQFRDGMSWDNYGDWHIDHKKPVSLFENKNDYRHINMLCNLQPMWAIENIKKSNKFKLNNL